MRAFAFYLTLPFIYLISVLPFPLLYGFCDFAFFILYHVMGYRKKVVWTNLKKAFPEKSDEEILKLRKKYYHYLCDLFIESFKTLTISQKSMLKHCTMKKSAGELLDKLYAEHKNVIAVMGHYGNWEWAGNTFSLTRKHQLYVIYRPMKNKFFDRFFLNMRKRFGTQFIPIQNTLREILSMPKDKPSTITFISDQSPNPHSAHWMTFMNQDTPVFVGTEKIAKRLNYPVVYFSVQRQKRGYYEIDCELLFEEPKKTAEFEITERHTRRLEQDIRKTEFTWLWSHRRWKHRRPSAVSGQRSAVSGQ